MAITNDGGQAFPTPTVFDPAVDSPYTDDRIHACGHRGMSLRDYFAGQALSGIVFAMTAEDRRRFRDGYSDGLAAETAYAIADAMLKAREAK